MIISGGENVSSAEIESALSQTLAQREPGADGERGAPEPVRHVVRVPVGRGRRRGAVAAAVTAAMLACVSASASASAEAVWLCGPEVVGDPCEAPLDTTVREAGAPAHTSHEPRGPRAVDCFYVYPTASNQLTPTADRSRGPELAAMARLQAARFSQHCRVFAPIYRQSTLASIVTAMAGVPREEQVAYADVLEAWRAYLARDDGRRGVVLLGHSQGTRMLRQLLRREIEAHPDQLRRLVGAILLGGDVTVAQGRLTGGDFRRTPLCTRRAEVGCVVAYSTFSQDPPGDAGFGRSAPPPAGDASTLPGGPGYAIACTDPRPLAGMNGPLRLLWPTEPFAPGLVAVALALMPGTADPRSATTWVVPPDRFAGDCRTVNGATVLRYDPVGSRSRRPLPFPDASWGTHLIDVNLGLDALVALVGQQVARWTRPEIRLVRRCTGRGRLRVALAGRDAEFAGRATVRVGARVVARGALVRPRLLRGLPRGRVLRVVADLQHGAPAQVTLSRSLPRC